MLLCKKCGKVIANTNAVVRYGICAACPMEYDSEKIMKFKVFSNQEERWALKHAIGTSLKDTVDCSFDELIDAFGHPTSGKSADEKCQVEWAILYEDGRVCTIYDWKEYDTPVEQVRDWHLGGKDNIAPGRIKKLIMDNQANK